ncbi:MAG: response regulator transcription factor, partial [Gammaproteobacteria bacterium]|nr:response regulator transcription factor [Gammaproteobacteria bacterium]
SGEATQTLRSNKNRLESLTKRELLILDELEQGLSNQKIADTLFLSITTVKWHLANIYSKLNAKNRMEVMAALRKN